MWFCKYSIVDKTKHGFADMNEGTVIILFSYLLKLT